MIIKKKNCLLTVLPITKIIVLLLCYLLSVNCGDKEFFTEGKSKFKALFQSLDKRKILGKDFVISLRAFYNAKLFNY